MTQFFANLRLRTEITGVRSDSRSRDQQPIDIEVSRQLQVISPSNTLSKNVFLNARLCSNIQAEF